MSWNDIFGQELAKRTLTAHLDSGKVAGAYLFAGPEGVGKRLLALEFAKALNCSSDGSRPCDACTVCQQITRGVHPDVHRIVPVGASNQIRIDDIRQMLGRIGLRPYSARVQVAILERVERLTEEAANSLLKSLEEPTTTTCFVLTTEQLPHCLSTIVSRCQVIRCHPVFAQPPRQDLRPADPASTAWFEAPLPESRQDVERLLEDMIGRLRDLSAAAAADAARHADVDRCVHTAFEVITLRESLEQFVSPRLVAALAREKWLALTSV